MFYINKNKWFYILLQNVKTKLRKTQLDYRRERIRKNDMKIGSAIY